MAAAETPVPSSPIADRSGSCGGQVLLTTGPPPTPPSPYCTCRHLEVDGLAAPVEAFSLVWSSVAWTLLVRSNSIVIIASSFWEIGSGLMTSSSSVKDPSAACIVAIGTCLRLAAFLTCFRRGECSRGTLGPLPVTFRFWRHFRGCRKQTNLSWGVVRGMTGREVSSEGWENGKHGDQHVKTWVATKDSPGHMTSASGNIIIFYPQSEWPPIFKSEGNGLVAFRDIFGT